MSVFINGIKSSWFNFKRILEGNKMTVQFTGPCPLTLELLMTMKPNDQSNLSFLGEECGLCKEKIGSHRVTSSASASPPVSSQRPIAPTFLGYRILPYRFRKLSHRLTFREEEKQLMPLEMRKEYFAARETQNWQQNLPGGNHRKMMLPILCF